MRARTASAAVLAAAALTLAPATAALAHSSSHSTGGTTASSAAKVKAEDRAATRSRAAKLERKAAKRKNFVLGGKVTAVSLADPAVEGSESTLTLAVHGGRYQALRHTEVTVTVAADAKVTRDGVVDLAAVQVGDHVVVKSRDFEISGTRHAELLVSARVHRVSASPADTTDATDTDEPVTTTDPVVVPAA